jgi:hypothetical protein
LAEVLKALSKHRSSLGDALALADMKRSRASELADFDNLIRDAKVPGQLRQWAAAAVEHSEALASWIAWLRAREDAKDEKLEGLVEIFTQEGKVASLGIAFERVVWRSLVRSAFDANPDLARFSGMRQEDIRRRFRDLDRKILELNRKQLRTELLATPIPQGAAAGSKGEWTDLALLRFQSGLQRPRIPIRRLISGGHGALKALKPCWMMSPGSIAQFLPQGLVEFDLGLEALSHLVDGLV